MDADRYLESLQQMHDEHEAWLRVGHEFKALGIDINDERYTPLVRGIELWGEKLHALRAKQPDEVVEIALQDKTTIYEATSEIARSNPY